MTGLRGALLTLILVTLAAGLGAAGGAAFILRHHAQPSFHQFVHQGLDLSQAQSQRIESLERQFGSRRSARETELRQANVELAAAIQETHSYSPQVQAAINHFHQVMGELQKETVLHILEMRSVLTPSQAEAFDRRVGTALTHSDQ